MRSKYILYLGEFSCQGKSDCFLESNGFKQTELVNIWLTPEIKKRSISQRRAVVASSYFLLKIKVHSRNLTRSVNATEEKVLVRIWKRLSLRMGSKYYLLFLIWGQKLK